MDLFDDADGRPLQDTPEPLDELDSLAQLAPTQRLHVAQAALTVGLKECFSPVAEHVSAGYQLHSCASVYAGPSPQPKEIPQLRVTMEQKLGSSNCSLQFVITICDHAISPAQGVRVLLLRARWALDGESPPRWAVCVLGDPTNSDTRVVDALMYKTSQLVLLQMPIGKQGSSTLAVRSRLSTG